MKLTPVSNAISSLCWQRVKWQEQGFFPTCTKVYPRHLGNKYPNGKHVVQLGTRSANGECNLLTFTKVYPRHLGNRSANLKHEFLDNKRLKK